ncbi:hypothetical protein C1H87_00675 [Flavivirga eckloniae]|uniref:Uncharacterized protein n=2 Tax=Flavivirga eckloniae TaxID=1803846 RepID=A0A2K9PJS6_9FLAO|nr:hypothetical protein C1H87_00675 [Flavivirga eckloniae]
MTSATVFAQKSVDAQITDLIKRDNTLLTEKDTSLKLTEAQEAKVREIYKELVVVLDKAPKSKKKQQEFEKTVLPKREETLNAVLSLLTPKQLEAYNTNGIH